MIIDRKIHITGIIMNVLQEQTQNENNNFLNILWVVLILVSAFIPFVMNYKYNDNHLNSLNHDYGKNLMMSTEKDSILMTEGGDNQVFSTLYFTYAEKIRPDLTPYDQKGNIFKRIYWDMRYVYPQTLQKRMQLVDSKLFSGEEPFYPDRTEAPSGDSQLLAFFQQDPYFIPYWMGTRPVYLTWTRPNPETLGDYYYKRYGIMYKVQDIEYSLVDYLEIKKEISLQEASQHLANRLQRTLSSEYITAKINKLIKEGLIRKSANGLAFVKMYPSPHPGNYLDDFLLNWKEVPNSRYWDYLTREIIINYDYQLGNIYLEKVKELKDLASTETRPGILKDINERIAENWEKAKEHYEDAVTFGGDSISSLHNIAVIYINNGVEDLSSRALPLLEKALDLYPNSIGTYQLMFNHLLRDSMLNPQNEAQDNQMMEKYMNELKHQLTLYKGTEKDYTKHPNWKNFAPIEQFMNSLKTYPNSRLMSDESTLAQQIKNDPSSVNLQVAQNVIINLFNRGMSFQHQPFLDHSRYYLSELISKRNPDAAFLSWAFQVSIQVQEYDLALITGIALEKTGSIPQGLGSQFDYYMGELFYAKGGTAQAKIYLQKFKDSLQRNLQAAVQQKQILDSTSQKLDSLNKQEKLNYYTPKRVKYSLN